MRLRFTLTLALALVCAAANAKKKAGQLFPDGTPIPAWFSDTTKVDVDKLGQKYVITDHGVKNDSTIIQTESTAYREQNRSLSQVAAGTSKSFDIDKSYTVIRAQAEGSLVQVLPVPSLSTSSVFRVDRVIYRGY